MLNKLAKLITEYCTNVKAGDEVLVISTYEAYPLVREIWREVVVKGGYPRWSLNDEILNEIFYRHAPEELLRFQSRIDEFMSENVDVRISVLSSTHSKHLVSVDPERIKIRAQAMRKLSEIFMRRDSEGLLRWVVTAYPTRAMAQEANMSPLEYEDFVFRSLKLHAEDPVSAWVSQASLQQRVAEVLSKVSELRIVSDDTDILLNVGGRVWINDDGRNNMPGGEVFTGPHEDFTEGFIRFDFPAVWRGVEVRNARLVFQRGEVVKADAEVGGELLRKMLETDEGARRLGEVAFGLNYDITRFTKEILFDEKIGGTIHMALGASYLKTGGINKSSIHWDLIKDMRRGKVFADGELIYEDGRFIAEVVK
ncbi:MAG: aminopeptidase [Zestosphaera sp.]